MIFIFTDGSSKGNPGPGGFGCIIRYDEQVVELGGFEKSTTNNRMEMRAIITALEQVKNTQEAITIHTDSKYVIDGITKWVFGWQKNGWMTKNKTEVLNRDLWEILVGLIENKKISWDYVAGHVGIPGNERVDMIANSFASGNPVSLYNGKVSEYTIALDQTKPQFTKKTAEGKAYSYLSFIDGVLTRHATWAECEKAVKGKKAKFRKAVSSENEKEIMKEWGIME